MSNNDKKLINTRWDSLVYGIGGDQWGGAIPGSTVMIRHVSGGETSNGDVSSALFEQRCLEARPVKH